MTTWVPRECTLPTAAQPLRVEEFDALFARAMGSVQRPTPSRLEVVLPSAAAPAARDLVARETACCSFFTFTLRAVTGRTELAIEVPDAHAGVLDMIQRRIEVVRPG